MMWTPFVRYDHPVKEVSRQYLWLDISLYGSKISLVFCEFKVKAKIKASNGHILALVNGRERDPSRWRLGPQATPRIFSRTKHQLGQCV